MRLLANHREYPLSPLTHNLVRHLPVRFVDKGGPGRDKSATAMEDFMAGQDAPQPASPDEEARIAETPAVFANKVYVSPLPGGAKVTFSEARLVSGDVLASPRAAVFLQHADLAVLRQLLDQTASAADTPPASTGGSVH